ncbi:MAG TPA: hypothetical protein VIC54_01995 [Terriglobales bacterium]
MRRWRPRAGLSGLLCLVLVASAWAAAPAIASGPATLRDMAACCRRMAGHCPMAPADRDCCQQRVAAPAPAPWIAPAPAPAAAPVALVALTPAPLLLPARSAAVVLLAPGASPPASSILRV